jgi:uncharacterized protein (TIGR03000 family)
MAWPHPIGRNWYAGRGLYYPYAGSYNPGYASYYPLYAYYPPYGYYPPADYSEEVSLASVPDYQTGGISSARADQPLPTGGPPIAPPDAGLIQLQVPDQFAEVTFNGQSVSSVGSTREYVTPPLQTGKTYHYTIAVTRGQGDRQKTMQRTVDIAAGQIRALDFTAVAKGSMN